MIVGFLSPDGKCYSFDHRANGYGRGEGVACVILKPLVQALKDGDMIRAVIRNTGINQDGKTPGVTFPNAKSQKSLSHRVYTEVGLDPLDTTYVETHGTGTQAGDPVEASALFATFGKERSEPLQIGSIKSNIGHLEGASGVTGLIKTVLMLERERILPNYEFEAPNKRIPLAKWNLQVCSRNISGYLQTLTQVGSYEMHSLGSKKWRSQGICSKLRLRRNQCTCHRRRCARVFKRTETQKVWNTGEWHQWLSQSPKELDDFRRQFFTRRVVLLGRNT